MRTRGLALADKLQDLTPGWGVVKELACNVSDLRWQLPGSGKQSNTSTKESMIVLGKLVTDLSEVSRNHAVILK